VCLEKQKIKSKKQKPKRTTKQNKGRKKEGQNVRAFSQ
jgi:hypothetical protein